MKAVKQRMKGLIDEDITISEITATGKYAEPSLFIPESFLEYIGWKWTGKDIDVRLTYQDGKIIIEKEK